RHGTELGVGGGGDEVGGTGTEGGHAHAGVAGQAAIGGGHEAGGLFVPVDDQLDLRAAQRFEQIEVFLAGNGEHILHAFRFEGAYKEVRGFHATLLGGACAPGVSSE